MDHIARTSSKLNASYTFEGIRYEILTRRPDEPILLLGVPVTNTKLKFNKRMKDELSQIPRDGYGVIIFNSSWSFGSFSNYVYYARELLRKEGFERILAIIIWDQFQDITSYKIIHRNNLSTDFLDFLEIPFND